MAPVHETRKQKPTFPARAVVRGTGPTNTNQGREGQGKRKGEGKKRKKSGDFFYRQCQSAQKTAELYIRTTVLRGCELNIALLTGHTTPTRLKGRVAALGLAGRQFLSFHLAGARSGRDLGATMASCRRRRWSRRTALYNFEKGNYRRVGKWGNTLFSAVRNVESKQPRVATAPNDVETQRERHRLESRECISGMRSPWRQPFVPWALASSGRLRNTLITTQMSSKS